MCHGPYMQTVTALRNPSYPGSVFIIRNPSYPADPRRPPRRPPHIVAVVKDIISCDSIVFYTICIRICIVCCIIRAKGLRVDGDLRGSAGSRVEYKTNKNKRGGGSC